MSVSIGINHVVKKYGENTIIPDLSVEIKNGEFFTLLGPSGCGKTTLLRLIAGLIKPDSGGISGVPLRISFLFQEDRLLPWLTAEENVQAVLPNSKKEAAAVFCWSSREEIPHVQGKRNPTKTVGVTRGHQRAETLKP